MLYLAKHGKSYGTKEEYEFRLEQFRQSLHKIREHNSRNDVTYSLGLNKFSDMTHQEYKKLLGYKNPQGLTSSQIRILETEEGAAEGVDWRS